MTDTFVESIDAAQAHREAYIAILKNALRKRGGKKEFARELGIRPEHLSNLLNPGIELAGDKTSFKRTPSPELAARIMTHLPLESEARTKFQEHLEMVWQGESAALIPYASQRWLTRYTIDDLLRDIGKAHFDATGTPDLDQARHTYQVVARACHLIVGRIEPYPDRVSNSDPDLDSNPLEFVQVCLFLHDVQCVLNHTYDALAHAKYAYGVMAACDPEKFRARREYFDHLLVNTAVAECLAYRNMGLHKEANEASNKPEMLVEDLESTGAQFWLPHILLHRLKGLTEQGNFAVGDVDSLVRQAEEAYQIRPKDLEFEVRLHVQLLEARARGYLEYGVKMNSKLRCRRAAQLLQDSVDRIDELPLGSVQKTRLLRTYASAQWRLGNLDAWRY